MQVCFRTVDVVHSEDWKLNPSGRDIRRVQSDIRTKSEPGCDDKSSKSSRGRVPTDNQAWEREVLVQVSSLQQTNFHSVKLLPQQCDLSDWLISVRSGDQGRGEEETIMVDDSMRNKLNLTHNALVYDHEHEDLISMLNVSPTTAACLVKMV
ncbi:hypothetical protein CORC01_02083 [Colletotrichum orchidophilum]|uniref:Uncharacterized protein n=1 Tax=Colletotrichum orchidophilum TaxID=1209926 RepID=A0A1G4BN09_9PEZI|nr:uncharacterized protein CORC01_02083 [Colletotrichum orchidophilum]OHF02687.1 hypothetical protein CORC01_02083 [Colletotrichum orchidophilum]